MMQTIKINFMKQTEANRRQLNKRDGLTSIYVKSGVDINPDASGTLLIRQDPS
jgi:hypothetical protein